MFHFYSRIVHAFYKRRAELRFYESIRNTGFAYLLFIKLFGTRIRTLEKKHRPDTLTNAGNNDIGAREGAPTQHDGRYRVAEIT